RLVLARPEEADDRRARPQQVRFVNAEHRMLIRRLYFQQDVGLVPQLPRVGDHSRARVGVVLVIERRAGAGLTLDEHVEAELLEAVDALRRRGDAALTRTGFFRNRDVHQCCWLVLEAAIAFWMASTVRRVRSSTIFLPISIVFSIGKRLHALMVARLAFFR